MYDINDDELKEMYESPGKSDIKLGKGISPADPLSSLCLLYTSPSPRD